MDRTSSAPAPVAEAPAPPAQARYVGAGPHAAFAVLHRPAAPARDVAVLLLAPFGWEDMCSYRGRRHWAHELAGAGHPVLRLDLPGGGDSAGTPRDPGLLEAWVGAIGAAAQELRAATGARRVAAVGPSLGGLLAVLAAARGTVDDLALWGVPCKGRRLVRELRAFAAVENAPGYEDPDDDALSIAGYALAAETVAALEAVDLSAVALPEGDHHVLLLERDGREVDAALRTALEAAGAEVRVAPGEGYAKMLMVEPQEARPSATVLAELRRWLDGFAQPAEDAPSAAEPEAPTAELVLEVDGARVRETPLALPAGDLALPAILAAPADGEPRDLTVVLLNAGPQRRIGPNRMWVETSRRWAARGVPVARLDLDGIGDADGDDTQYLDVHAFYRPAFVDHVRQGLDALAARGLSARFVVGGLCAGGWWSLQTALADDRVVSALLVNPGAIVFDGGWERTLFETAVLWQKAFKLETWRRVFRGETTFIVHVRTLRRLLAGAVRSALGRLTHRPARRREPELVAPDPVDGVLDGLRDRGVEVLLLFAGPERLQSTLETGGRWGDRERWPNVDFRHLPGDVEVHTLRPLPLQREVHRALDEAIERALHDGR